MDTHDFHAAPYAKWQLRWCGGSGCVHFVQFGVCPTVMQGKSYPHVDPIPCVTLVTSPVMQTQRQQFLAE